MLQLQRFLADSAALSATEQPFAATLLAECTAFKSDLDAALSASLIRTPDGAPYFVPPYAAANFTPYKAMPFSNKGSPQQDYGGGAAYANFRYWSEMLSSQFMGPKTDVAISDFREQHYGTLSAMTRFRTHLDDMPAAGYAYSSAATNRTQPYNSLLFGHIANYQSRGSFNAPEQLGFNRGKSSSPRPHAILITLISSSPHPHLILTSSSPRPHLILTIILTSSSPRPHFVITSCSPHP